MLVTCSEHVLADAHVVVRTHTCVHLCVPFAALPLLRCGASHCLALDLIMLRLRTLDEPDAPNTSDTVDACHDLRHTRRAPTQKHRR